MAWVCSLGVFDVRGEGDLMPPPCPWLLDFHPGSSPENSGNSSKETLLLMAAPVDSVYCLDLLLWVWVDAESFL